MVMFRWSECANLLLVSCFRAVQRAALEKNILALGHLNSFGNTVYKTLYGYRREQIYLQRKCSVTVTDHFLRQHTVTVTDHILTQHTVTVTDHILRQHTVTN